MMLEAETSATQAGAPASLSQGLPPRECGGCTLCCKTMSVWEIEKPNNVWCRHVRNHTSCSIYETRPNSCRTFNCLWLRGVGTDAMRPDRSRVVLVEAEDEGGGPKGIAAILDPTRPLAWQEPAMRGFLEQVRDGYGAVGMALGTRKRVFRAGQPLQTP
ncbi:YkgJ family cysteine cluster protein [Enterovirga sp. CN4-39]|uniref:YkgJ family cysteine cluster protein n=1 Tax=Enterovirga sp. CN4-39 TaxID=3400910 RepID=UPI003C04560C